MAGRILATAIIWIAITIILATSLTSAVGPMSNVNSGAVFGITLVLAITAGISTLAIWMSGEHNQKQDEAYSKTKRTHPNRVRRLVESLSDDEIYELESMLLNQQQPDDRHERS